MKTAEVGFVSAALCLRPPRVAILVADDDHWRDWAMSALAAASDYWGGAGFILVPYSLSTGRPSASFSEIVRAYDPDHVVTLELSIATWEDWYPGTISMSGEAYEVDRGALMETSRHLTFEGEAARTARSEVASWCSPMRVTLSAKKNERPREVLKKIGRHNPSDSYRRVLAPAPLPSPGARLAAAASWRSDIGLLAALRVGIASSEPQERPEPPLDGLSWLAQSTGDAPESLRWSNYDFPPASSEGLEPWFLGEQKLTQVSRAHLQDGAAIVIGDSAEDFALALAYDRIIGRGVWLTSALVDDPQTFERNVRPSIWPMISNLEQGGSHLVVTSATATPEYVAEIARRVQVREFGIGATEPEIESETVQVRAANLEGGYLDYVVEEHIGVSMSLPVSKLPDGSMNALAGMETPVPVGLLFPKESSLVPYWYVDVTLYPDAIPRGRDMPAKALTLQEGSFPEVNLRASRAGVTFDPYSMGFVPAGALLPSRIGRPRLRALSMTAWVEGMAEVEGLGVRLSSAGRQAELVRSRLGTRQELLDLIASTHLPMLRAFVRHDRAPQPSERDPNMVVLGVDPYLSFAAIDSLLGGTRETTMNLIDSLVAARLLRRGLILDCAECGRPSFVDADRLGQNFECPQCANMNALVSDRWKRESAEPRWFYDLYTTFRELLGANGDVVLLAAARLQRSSRDYTDTPELEFYDLASGKAVAEVDVIASVDGEVVIVEAKSNGAFESRKRGTQSQKLLSVAKIIRADRILLATTRDRWNATDVGHLTQSAGRLEPFSLKVDVAASLS